MADNSPAFKAMRTRYRDAYNVARITTGIGAGIKVFGFLLGALVAMAAFLGSQQTGWVPGIVWFGVILGAVIATLFYVCGALIAAQGQILLATLDVAVNSTELLSLEEKAEIMYVPVVSTSAGTQTSRQATSPVKDRAGEETEVVSKAPIDPSKFPIGTVVYEMDKDGGLVRVGKIVEYEGAVCWVKFDGDEDDTGLEHWSTRFVPENLHR